MCEREGIFPECVNERERVFMCECGVCVCVRM